MLVPEPAPPDIQDWSDERLCRMYYRYSFDLHCGMRFDTDKLQEMVEIEREMRIRGLDTDAIAKRAQKDAR